MSGQTEPAAAAGHLSPDGYWWWNGAEWVPATGAQPQPPPYEPAAPRATGAWVRNVAGVLGLVGALAMLVACIVPYGTFPDPSGGPATTSSIFSGGFTGAAWDIPEAVVAILLGLVAAPLLLLGISRTVQGLSAGMLLAAGVQSTMMWLAYVGLASTDGSAGAGGIIGIAGAWLMVIGGVMGLVGLAWRPPSA